MIICKDGAQKWRIPTEKGYRYFTQKDIDTYTIRKQMAETPIEILQFRNNVEASIFQLGYHYPNAKSRYRGEIKHQMWANIRCLWVNFVRILNYIKQLCQRTLFFAKYAVNWLFTELYFVIKSFLTANIAKQPVRFRKYPVLIQLRKKVIGADSIMAFPDLYSWILNAQYSGEQAFLPNYNLSP